LHEESADGSEFYGLISRLDSPSVAWFTTDSIACLESDIPWNSLRLLTLACARLRSLLQWTAYATRHRAEEARDRRVRHRARRLRTASTETSYTRQGHVARVQVSVHGPHGGRRPWRRGRYVRTHVDSGVHLFRMTHRDCTYRR